MKLYIRNPAGTRSIAVSTQAQLDIIASVMQLELPTRKFEAECIRQLTENGYAPDFQGSDSRWDFTNARQALDVLSEVYYSAEGSITRYPDSDRYEAALRFLKQYHNK